MLISASIHHHRELKFSGLNERVFIYLGKVGLEELMDKLTRSHLGPGGKESHQCLVCAKWYAVPPIKHMRSHILTLR